MLMYLCVHCGDGVIYSHPDPGQGVDPLEYDIEEEYEARSTPRPSPDWSRMSDPRLTPPSWARLLTPTHGCWQG